MGGWRRSNLCMFSSPTTFPFTSTSWPTPCYWRRCPTFRRRTLHVHRYRLPSEQDLSTIQRDLQHPSLSLDDMDYQKLPSLTTTRTSGRSMDKFYSISSFLTSQPHHPQRHYTIQTTLPGGDLSQWRQTSYIPSNLLPYDLLPVPHQNLRRSDGLSQIEWRPTPHHREDHRRHQQTIWQGIPVGPWCWTWSTKRICPPET